MSIDTQWALSELRAFLALTELYRPHDPPGVVTFTSQLANRGKQADINESAYVVEQILARVLPDWRQTVPSQKNKTVNRWYQHRESAQRACAALERDAEVKARLGDGAPQLSAGTMHPWAWEGARSLWQSRHYREAVTAAARKINAETQNKLSRYDLGETRLFQQSFSTDPPKPGQPRLRLCDDNGSETFRSMHRGVMAFAEGCYAAIRNPNSHESGLSELPEHEALEQLAAFSLLARWIDIAKVETA